MLAFLSIVTSLTAQDRRPLRVDGQQFTPERRSDNDRPQVPESVCPSGLFRSFDGTCNNVSRMSKIEWGASDIMLRRSMTPEYGELDHYLRAV